MKKLLSALLIAALTAFGHNAFADVGCYNNGSYNSSTGMFQGNNHCGPTTDINWLSQTGSAQNTTVGMVRSVPAVDQNLFAAGVAQGDYTSIPSTTAAIPVGYAFVRYAQSSDSAFQSKTLANGYPGQILILENTGTTGTTSAGLVTITPTTSTGWSSLSTSKLLDTIVLEFVDTTIGWVILDASNPNSTASIIVYDTMGH